jgi:hypothetical protein
VLLERRELVDTCRDRNRAGGERPVRPVQRIHVGAYECPDSKVRPDEERHGAHTTAGMSALKTAGAAPGSIIAAIIDTHRATKNASEPSRVATPISIPLICRTATTQDAAASPSVAVSAAAVAAVLARVMAAEREVYERGILALERLGRTAAPALRHGL